MLHSKDKGLLFHHDVKTLLSYRSFHRTGQAKALPTDIIFGIIYNYSKTFIIFVK